MTKWQLTSPSGGPLDYPALGFSAVNGAILDGALSTPAFTSAPGPEWAVYGGGSAEAGVNRYAPPSVVPTYTPLAIPANLQAAITAATATALGTTKVWARNPDQLVSGTVTRDSNGAATSAPVVWPDGTAGTYTALTLSSAFPGAVDSYQITYGSPVTKTYTQPTVTRDATGAATFVPAIVVS